MNIGIPRAMNMINDLNYTPAAGGYEICSNIQLHAPKGDMCSTRL